MDQLPKQIESIEFEDWDKVRQGFMITPCEVDFTDCKTVDQVVTKLWQVIDFIKHPEIEKPKFLKTKESPQSIKSTTAEHKFYRIYFGDGARIPLEHKATLFAVGKS